MSDRQVSTFADLLKVLEATKGQPILKRMAAVHGARYREAFRFGDWRGVSFEDQDISGISFEGCNLLHTRWNTGTNIDGCEFAGALLDRNILRSSGLDRAHFDEEQREQIAQWTRPMDFPVGLRPDQFDLPEGSGFTLPQYHTLIREAPDFATGAFWLRQMRSVGIEPTSILVTLVVAKQREHEGDDAIKAIVDPLIARGEADKHLINAALGNVDSYASARAWFNTLNIEGYTPDLYSYNGLIRLADVETGKALIAEMRARDITPDRHSYNPLIRKSSFSEATALIDEMKINAIRPGIIDYYALLKVASTKEEVEKSKARMVEDGFSLDVDSYNRMFSASDDFDDALKLWDDIIAGGFTPDHYSVRGLLRQCSSVEDLARALPKIKQGTNGQYPSITQAMYTLYRLDPSPSGDEYERFVEGHKQEGKSHRSAIRLLMAHCIPFGADLFDDVFNR